MCVHSRSRSNCAAPHPPACPAPPAPGARRLAEPAARRCQLLNSLLLLPPLQAIIPKPGNPGLSLRDVLVPIMSVIVSMSAGIVGGLLLSLLLAPQSVLMPAAGSISSQAAARWEGHMLRRCPAAPPAIK
jgi:hypothetical protein